MTRPDLVMPGLDGVEATRQIKQLSPRTQVIVLTSYHDDEPIAARYDRKAKRVVVDLRSGASFSFPPELAQELGGASATDLAKVVVTPSGSGLRWPTLDADFSLPALMLGIFGTQQWMAELGRRGGRVTSETKAATARANGKKGGRPKKAAAA